jgi:isochorismate synthase
MDETMMTLQIDTPATSLRTRLETALDQARRCGAPVLVSASEPLPWRDPLAFFAGSSPAAHDRVYWEAPNGELILVGIGAARTLTGAGAARFTTIAAVWRDLLAHAHCQAPPADLAGLPGVGPTLLGGFAFDPERPGTAAWTGYPDGLMILPRFLLTCAAGRTVLTACVVVEAGMDVAVEAARLEQERACLLATPDRVDAAPAARPALDVADILPAGDWQAAVAGVVADIQAGALEKVVLAREVAVTAETALDPVVTLRRLRAGYPDCYVFAVARGPRCFLGATPERLVRLADGTVHATCLAGTTRRGADAATDAQLGADLLASAKNQEEHAVVRRMLAEALGAVCSDVAVPAAPALLRLRNVQHLYTPIRGRLRNGTSLLELVARLHPTPAVGGFPRPAALARIRACEGMDRGWYAGPVGWLDARGDGEFAVALRSALVDGPTARAFAGCGIMGDSRPDDEYAETQVKLQAVLSALGETG